MGDALGVGAQVAVELAHRFAQLARFLTGVQRFQVDGEVLDGPQGGEDVAVPEKTTLGRRRSSRTSLTSLVAVSVDSSRSGSP